MSVRRGLGRGLDALLEAAPATGRSLPTALLQPNRFQPRTDFDDAGIEELAQSIRANGIVQPIVVTPGEGGRFTIVAGERRWRASQRAGLDQVPVVVRQVTGERELLELALVENLQRTDLNPVEEATAYRALSDDFGLSQDEIAQRVGKGRSTVANALRLLQLPPQVQEMLRHGRLTAGHARPLLALSTVAEQLALAEKAAKTGLTARQLEAAVRKGARGAGPRTARPRDVHSQAAAERLTKRLQTKVEIHRRGRGGHVRIAFHSEEELMRLYDVLLGQLGDD